MSMQETQEIYQALRLGLGHDRVTDVNVEALIGLAKDKGDAQTELLLREWRSSCGEDPAMPTLSQQLPPAAGKNAG